MGQKVYFNQLSEDCFYEVYFNCVFYSKVLGHNKYLTFKNYYYPKDIVTFANEICKSLSFHGDTTVEVIYEGDCVYRVKTNNITVPYIGYRINSDKVRESYPRYTVNPFYEVLDSFQTR